MKYYHMPVVVDLETIIGDLHSIGWKDQKLETVLGMSGGYIAKMNRGPRPERPYRMVQQIWNFWGDEFIIPLHGGVIPDFAKRQTLVIAQTT